MGADEVRQRRLVHEGVDVGLLDGALARVLVLLAGLIELAAALLEGGFRAGQLGASIAEVGGGAQAAGLHLGQLLLVALQFAGGLFQLFLQIGGLAGHGRESLAHLAQARADVGQLAGGGLERVGGVLQLQGDGRRLFQGGGRLHLSLQFAGLSLKLLDALLQLLGPGLLVGQLAL